MTPLEKVLKRCKKGFAFDLATDILNDNFDTSDADILFRTLVLDENWTVDDAKELYNQVSDITYNNE